MMKRILFLLLCSFLVQSVLAAKVDTLKVYSPTMDHDVRVVAIIPDAAATQTPCPAIYLLHGYGGDETAWLAINPALPAIADREGIAFICPGVGNSWYIDSAVRPNSYYDTFMSLELIPAIEKRYPLVTDRSGRAVTGLSMGGFGAMSLAIKHPRLFGAAGSMSGGLDIRPFPRNWELSELLGKYDEHPEAWDEVTPINLIPRIKDGDLAIIIDCGYDDFFFDVNNAFHQKLLQRGIMHDFYVRAGKHNATYWNNAVDYQVLFFRKFFNRKTTEK